MGWLYSDQSMSTLAIRHLSEVTEKIPTHFKAIFLQAKEHYKLGEQSTPANSLIRDYRFAEKFITKNTHTTSLF